MIRQDLYGALSPILDTYHNSAPPDNATFPVAIYYVSERPLLAADDTDLGNQIIVNLEIYLNLDSDLTILKTIELAISSMPDYEVHIMDKSDIVGIDDKIGISYTYDITHL